MKIKLNFKNKKNNLKAFAILESLIAISVLMVAILGPMTLAIQSLKYSKIANSNTVATYLANDAIEQAINYRYQLELECQSSGCISPSTDSLYTFHLNTNLTTNYINKLNCDLYLDNITKEYTCIPTANTTKTYFKRTINTYLKDDYVDSIGSYGPPTSVKIVSIICFSREPICDDAAKNKVTLVSYTY